MGADIHTQIEQMRKELEADFEKYGENIAKYAAQDIATVLTEEANQAISYFYSSYDPKYYLRHDNFWKTYKRYYKNRKPFFIGGVNFINNLPDVYDSPVQQVFNRVIYGGFHGPSSLYYHNPAPMYPFPLKRVTDKRDEIIQNISLYTDKAANKAKKDTYNYLFR